MARILLIEPDRLLADSYRAVLEHAGHEVLMCASAQSAIFGADALLPELVIMELQLSEHSGIEFLYEFRSYAEWVETPVIVLTQVPPAVFSPSQHQLRTELGVREYLYKIDTSLGKLLRTVDAVMQPSLKP